MNDKLSYEAINGIIESINQGLDKAPNYVVEIVDRYQNYYVTTQGLGVFCCFILFIFGLILTIGGVKDEEEWKMGVGLLLAFFGFIVGACFLGNLIQGIFVPEIALIQSFNSCGY